jgi:hypothetical protein
MRAFSALRFATRASLQHHSSETHGKTNYVANSICLVEGCERGAASKTFLTHDQLVDRMAYFYDIEIVNLWNESLGNGALE